MYNLKEDAAAFTGKRALISFLSWLDYCDQLIKEAQKVKVTETRTNSGFTILPEVSCLRVRTCVCVFVYTLLSVPTRRPPQQL